MSYHSYMPPSLIRDLQARIRTHQAVPNRQSGSWVAFWIVRGMDRPTEFTSAAVVAPCGECVASHPAEITVNAPPIFDPCF
jgi:hypothetical protein